MLLHVNRRIKRLAWKVSFVVLNQQRITTTRVQLSSVSRLNIHAESTRGATVCLPCFWHHWCFFMFLAVVVVVTMTTELRCLPHPKPSDFNYSYVRYSLITSSYTSDRYVITYVINTWRRRMLSDNLVFQKKCSTSWKRSPSLSEVVLFCLSEMFLCDMS